MIRKCPQELRPLFAILPTGCLFFKNTCTRERPTLDAVDVLVAGGGPAGIGAALAAAKGKVPRELKVPEIQDALRADKVDLDISDREQSWLRG